MHRDLKTENLLLDANRNEKMAGVEIYYTIQRLRLLCNPPLTCVVTEVYGRKGIIYAHNSVGQDIAKSELSVVYTHSSSVHIFMCSIGLMVGFSNHQPGSL